MKSCRPTSVGVSLTLALPPSLLSGERSPPLLARGRPSNAGPSGPAGARLTPLSLVSGERSPPLLAGRRPPRRMPPSLLSGGRSPPLLAGRRPRSRSPLLLAEGRPEAARRSVRPACRPAALEAVVPGPLAGRGEVLVEVEAEVVVLVGGLGESLAEAAELGEGASQARPLHSL